MIELQTMIILIEGEYPPEDRNTAKKMIALIKKEFGKDVSEHDIYNFYYLGEDYEKINRSIEYGQDFYY